MGAQTRPLHATCSLAPITQALSDGGHLAARIDPEEAMGQKTLLPSSPHHLLQSSLCLHKAQAVRGKASSYCGVHQQQKELKTTGALAADLCWLSIHWQQHSPH